jgi:hypothetical protein
MVRNELKLFFLKINIVITLMMVTLFVFRIWYFNYSIIFLLWQIISTIVILSLFSLLLASFIKKIRNLSLASAFYVFIMCVIYMLTDFALQIQADRSFGDSSAKVSLAYPLK